MYAIVVELVGVIHEVDLLGDLLPMNEDEGVVVVPDGTADGTLGGNTAPKSGNDLATAPARGVHAFGNSCAQKP